MSNLEIYKKRNFALILMSAAPLLAAGPFLIGIIGATLTPGCNESNCAWGVLPWFSFLTTPVAVVLFIFAFIKFVTSLTPKLAKIGTQTPEERKIRGYYRALLATAAGPLILVIVVLFSILGANVSICDSNGVCTDTGIGTFISTALVSAGVIIAASWIYLIALWIWNKIKP